MRVGLCGVAVLLVAGCASSGGGGATNAADAQSWLIRNSSAVRQMRGAAANVEVVLGQSGVGQYCAQLKANTTSVVSRLPSPDGQLTGFIKSSADHYVQAADLCITSDRAGTQRALSAGDRAMGQAVARSVKLGQSLYA